MLSDEVLEKVTERIISRLENVNTDILKQIGNSLDEIGKLTPTKAQELAQVLKYGGDYNKIITKLAEASKLSKKEIKEIFEEVAKNDYRFAKQFYDYRNIGYISYDENIALKNQVEAIANITADRCAKMINPRILGFGLIDKKTGEKEFKGLKQAYYQLLDEAVLSVSQGKETFNQAMSKRIKEMGSGGLKVIYDSTYINKEGNKINHTRRLDSAIRMNLKDSLRELHNETQKIFGEEFNADGVEISVHMNPAPDHELVQGRQFSNEEFEKFQNDETAISYGGMVFEPEYNGRDRRSISEYNCYHYVFSIVLGVSEPEYTNEQLQEIIDKNNDGFELDGNHYTNYQGTQMQRQLETAIREQKDIQIMAKASGQNDLVMESQQKITQLTRKYKELSAKANLPTKVERLKVSGYRRIKTETTKENIVDMLKKQNVTIDESLLGNDIDKLLLERTLKQFNNLINKYPILNDYIRKNGFTIKTDIYEYAGGVNNAGDEMILSKGLYKNKDRLISIVKEGQDDNWSSKVFEKNYDIYTITHETGHLLEDAIMQQRIKAQQGFNLNEMMYNNEYYGLRFKRQDDTDIFNELFLPASEELGVNWKELNAEYISDYGKSEFWFEWFAELFTKMELGEEDIMTKRLRKYLEGKLWKK